MLSTSEIARLTNASYYDNQRALTEAKNVHPDYELDEELSGRYQKVFYNPTTKNTTVAFRGTSVKDAKDIVADSLYLIGMGRHSSRFKNGKTLVNKVIAKYSKENVELGCHSLSGNICNDVSKDLDVKATSFNPGKTLIPASKAPKNTKHRVIGDPLSSTGTSQLPRDINPHSLRNFY